MASNHAFVISVVKRSMSVASLAFTELKTAGITRGMITSIPTFPLSKSKFEPFATGVCSIRVTARTHKTPFLENLRRFIVLAFPLKKLMDEIQRSFDAVSVSDQRVHAFREQFHIIGIREIIFCALNAHAQYGSCFTARSAHKAA